MEAEDAAFNDSGEGKVVEEGGEVLPHVGVTVFTEAFIVETIDLGDLFALVVASEDCDSLRVANFEANKERHCLNGVVATIDIIAHEKVVVVR